MPYAAGVYTAPSSPGAFNPAVTGSPATPEAWNALLTDMSTALSTAILKDGTQTVTANIPFGGFQLKNLAVGTLQADAPTVRQAQGGNLNRSATVGGTADAIILTLAPQIDGYDMPITVTFKATATNTGATTVNVNNCGIRQVQWPDGSQLVAGDIVNNGLVDIEWNGDVGVFMLMSTTSPTTKNILTTLGDMYYRAPSGVARLARGTAGTIPMSVTTAGRLQTTVAYSLIRGLTYQNNGADATNDIDIAEGSCMDATNAYPITVAALTKQSDAVWAVGTGAGMLDTGAVGNNDYYLWAIARSDTGVTDILCSLSSTAPTMPANYDFKRLIGWFKRTGGAIVTFKTYESEGGGLRLMWDSPTLDINLGGTLTTTRRTDAVKTPQNISTDAILNLVITDTAGAVAYVYCPDMADLAPGTSTAAPLGTINVPASGTAYHQVTIKTSATGTIAARSSVATMDQYSVSTLGFNWSRR